MSKQANRTVIGGFLVGSVILLAAGILVFGSGKFLKKTYICVMYFDGSVKGLNEGASVVLRGVKIGTVRKILLRAKTEDLSFEIPVFVEIEPDRLEKVEEGKTRTPGENIEKLIALGLRAQLEMQSMVTGQLIVQLDFHPDEPARLIGDDPQYPEIPTIPTDMAVLLQKIEKVPIEKIFEKLLSTVEGLEKVVNSPEVTGIIHSLKSSLDSADSLLGNIDRHIEPLASGMEGTLRDAQKLVRNIDNQVGPLASGLTNAVDAATTAINQAEKTLITVENSFGEDSTLIYALNDTLEALSSASRSIRLLADYLNRHPESLLRGKGGPK